MNYVSPIEEIDDSKFPLPVGGSRAVHPVAVMARMSAGDLTETLYPIAAGHYRAVRRHFIPARVRPNPMFIYCLSGRGTVEIQGRKSRVGAGDFVVLPASLEHSYGTDASQPWTILWVYFSGCKASRYCDLLGKGEVLHIGVRSDLIASVNWQLGWNAPGYSEANIALACAKLAHTFVEFAAAAEHVDQAIPDGNIDKTCQWMRTCLDQPISLEEAASVSGLSRFHFIRKFRTVTGYSPVMYHTVLRMQRACEILDTTNVPVSHIGEQVGYPEPQHFSRVFKRVMGISPRHYRATNSHQAHATVIY